MTSANPKNARNSTNQSEFKAKSCHPSLARENTRLRLSSNAGKYAAVSKLGKGHEASHVWVWFVQQNDLLSRNNQELIVLVNINQQSDYIQYHNSLSISFLLAPSAPPANVSVNVTSFDTIIITWDEVPEKEQNGIVRIYKLYVKTENNVIEHDAVIDAHVTTLEVSNLADNTYYCAHLLAYTVAEGPLSACVNITTLKRGKNLGSCLNTTKKLSSQVKHSSQNQYNKVYC